MKINKFYSYIIPSIIASIFLGIYTIVDGFFVGQSLNDYGLGAINLAWPITSLVQTLGLGIGLAGGVIMSTSMGEGNTKKAYKAQSMVLVLILLFGIVLTVILPLLLPTILHLFNATGQLYDYAHEYLLIIMLGSIFHLMGGGLLPLVKNKGKMKYAMLISIMGTACNFILDYFWIYKYDFGLTGAAVASVLSQAVIGIGCLILLLKDDFKFSLDLKIARNILRSFFAPFILNYSYSIILIFNNYETLKYSDYALSAYTILSYILYVVSMSMSGCVDGVQPLISYYHGKKESENKFKILKKTIVFSFCFTILQIVLFYFMKDMLHQIFGINEIAIKYYNNAIFYYLIGFVFIFINKITCGYSYSISNNKIANILTVLEPLILTPLFLFSLSAIFESNGVWLSFTLIQITLAIISSIVLLFEIKKENKYIHA